MKRLIGISLILFAAAGFLTAAADVVDMHGRRNDGEKPEQVAAPNKEAYGNTCVIDVYFFYGNAKCPTCDIIKEEASRVIGALEQTASKEPALSLWWSEANVEEPGNEQYILDYGLFTSTIVLADRRDPERWKRLDEVWDLASNRKQLSDFLRHEIIEFAKGCAS
ncbi:MAG: nitrophenyl compound nitroreductase subunit ArsF family protein [Thermovirgaceae bacterium]